MADFEEERFMRSTVGNGHRPYTMWESLTDTATTPNEKEATGNYTSPKTKGERGIQMGELRERMRLLLAGGVGKSNTKQLRAEPDGGGNGRERDSF